MKLSKILFASHNAGKISEIKNMLAPLGIEVVSSADVTFPDVEETGTTFAENSLLKSQTIAKALGIPCIADDSGLCVDALNGAPGVYSARYAPNRDFDKGIDKILKKVGEECTEIVIAAKNPDASEIKYEIADFLYHAMVLMVEKCVTWDEINDELARRE